MVTSVNSSGLPVKDLRTKDYYEKRKSQMALERQSFIPHWRECAEFIRPRRGRFLLTDRNRGDKRYSSIINSKAGQAFQVAKSGMLAGSMSPARPWFSLETANPEFMDNVEVKIYLRDVHTIMRTIFNESNFYGMASDFLGELIMFGTAAMSHIDDFEDVSRFYTHTAGSYMIAANDRYKVDTIYREFEWTVQALVQKFGVQNVSQFVKDAYDRGNYNTWAPVCHAVEPNHLYNPNGRFATDKAWKSVYYEPTERSTEREKLLSVSGFDEFPAHVVRWDVTGEDVYGTDCPGMTALGDIKGLQIEERRKAQAIDKMVHPPLTAPPGIRNNNGNNVNQLPGGVTVYDGQGNQKIESLYHINPQLNELRLDINAVERRIDTAFYVDMFLAISHIEGIQPRNELDIIQRDQERMLQLGPVQDHIQSGLLGPLINRTFNQCVRAGIFPDPPEFITNNNLNIKYISTLAMAQKSVATQNISRVVEFAANFAQVWPDAPRKIDIHQAIDQYANAVGVDPSILVTDELLAIEQAKDDAVEQRQAELVEDQMVSETQGQIVKNANEA